MAVPEFVDPCVEEKSKKVVSAVVFAKCPLSVAESVGGVKKGEEGDCKEPFYHFG